jgi:hypothetical protein
MNLNQSISKKRAIPGEILDNSSVWKAKKNNISIMEFTE